MIKEFRYPPEQEALPSIVPEVFFQKSVNKYFTLLNIYFNI